MGRNRKFKLKRSKNKKKKSQSPPPPHPPWLELPQDITANILHRLSAFQILENAQKVCSLWRSICKDPSMWRFIDMKDTGHFEGPGEDGYLDIMCLHAVDRSQGQMTELHIDHFGSDELLEQISERSSKLRCLQIRGCYRVGGDGLLEAVKKFPLLEELHFVFVKNVYDGIETIGHSCPKLKSFTLSGSDYKHQHLEYSDDDIDPDFEALSIAKSMPGLRHLRLVGNIMTNKGLEAILDGCPHLESLDIRRCVNVDLRGGIGNRIPQEIKDFKRPHDAMEEGCKWDANMFDCEYDLEEDYSSDYLYHGDAFDVDLSSYSDSDFDMDFNFDNDNSVWWF